jgi:hypothetical protein
MLEEEVCKCHNWPDSFCPSAYNKENRFFIIFLDIDGVFVTGDYIVNQYELTGKANGRVFNPQSVELFNQIIEQTGAKVVISSTWRFGRSINELQELLNSKGFKNVEVIGKTGVTNHGVRGREIQDYLNTLEQLPDKFIILDDDADMEHLMPHLFKTDFNTGLTDSVTNDIIKYFNFTVD